MAKSNNQKAKILFLEHMLRETGENHTVSMQEILECLNAHGIMAERKSVYDDMEALRSFGMDVRFRRGRPGGYYLAGQTQEQESAALESSSAETERTEERKGSSVNTVEENGTAVFVRNSGVPDKKMKLIYEADREQDVRSYFGDAAEYTTRPDGTLMVVTPLLSDAQFYGWLTAMGTSVKIAKPKKAGQAYREYLKLLSREYKGI